MHWPPILSKLSTTSQSKPINFNWCAVNKPVGLFAVHQLGIKGLKAVVIDNLDKAGGQCIELYPDKPIYDIPAVPECTGEELTNNLINQLKPFDIKFHLNERVDEIKKENESWEGANRI